MVGGDDMVLSNVADHARDNLGLELQGNVNLENLTITTFRLRISSWTLFATSISSSIFYHNCKAFRAKVDRCVLFSSLKRHPLQS